MDKGELVIAICLTVLTAVVIPSVSWLAKKIVTIDRDFVIFKAKSEKDIATIYNNCEKHHQWSRDIQRSINRTDRNIQAVCQHLNIGEYEKPD